MYYFKILKSYINMTMVMILLSFQNVSLRSLSINLQSQMFNFLASVLLIKIVDIYHTSIFPADPIPKTD